MLRVGVIGAAGRMGREVCSAVNAAGDLELVATLDQPGEGSGAADGPALRDDLEALTEARVDVAVDFTATDPAREHIAWCTEHGVHLVVGTSGLTPDDFEDAERRCQASGVHVAIVANFAIGAVLLMRFCEMAAPFMDGAEVIELHHDAKRDAPSGTAMATAARIAEARARAGVPALAADATELRVLEGARGGEGPGAVRIHSVRLPGLVAHQEVVFGATAQSLTVRHDSYDRRSFMPGVLLAVRALPERPGLTIGLEPILGL